jgi:hypothetical protein
MLSQQARASIDRQGVHATDGGADGGCGYPVSESGGLEPEPIHQSTI